MFYVYLKKDEILVMISQEKKPCLRNFERSIIKSFKKSVYVQARGNNFVKLQKFSWDVFFMDLLN